MFLPLTAAAFRALGFRRWLATLQRWSPQLVPNAWDDAQADRVAWLVDVAARFVASRDSCLSRAMILWWLLRRRGLQGQLRIGVRKRNGRLEAHAWVEYRGQILSDRNQEHVAFVPFDRAVVPYEGVLA
jgi:hypothetical protein